MAWIIPGAAVTGNPIPASFGNDVIGDLTILETQVALFGAGQAIAGSPPATTAPNFLMQVGVQIGICGSSGTMTVTFPTPFPNGIFGCWGINAQNGGLHFWVETDTVNTAAASFQCMVNSTTPLNTQPVTIPWIAIGFR